MGKYGLDNINKPAYDAAHQEIEELRGEVPTDAEITALSNAAIQADKDIISQIVISQDEDEQTTSIEFPEGIKPLYFYVTIDNTAYELTFDYENEVAINLETGDILDFTVYSDGTKVLILINSLSDIDLENACVEYINRSMTDEGFPAWLNTYYLYRPVTNPGTKLYEHTISFYDEDDNYFAVKIINTNGSPIDISSQANLSSKLGLLTTEACEAIMNTVYTDTLHELIYRGKIVGTSSSVATLKILGADGVYNLFASFSLAYVGTDTVKPL